MNLSTVVYTYMYDMSPDDVIYDPLPLYHRAASAFLNMALYKGSLTVTSSNLNNQIVKYTLYIISSCFKPSECLLLYTEQYFMR